jgi:hypothetical protein
MSTLRHCKSGLSLHYVGIAVLSYSSIASYSYVFVLFIKQYLRTYGMCSYMKIIREGAPPFQDQIGGKKTVHSGDDPQARERTNNKL